MILELLVAWALSAGPVTQTTPDATGSNGPRLNLPGLSLRWRGQRRPTPPQSPGVVAAGPLSSSPTPTDHVCPSPGPGGGLTPSVGNEAGTSTTGSGTVSGGGPCANLGGGSPIVPIPSPK